MTFSSFKLFISLLIFGFLSKVNSSKDFFQNIKSTKENEIVEDSCFCQLYGAIDDCSCQIDTVDHFNNFKIYPRVQSLLEKDYFRYFQVNLKKKCPYWADDGSCSLETCQVKPCRDDEVPFGLKGLAKNEITVTTVEANQCTEDLGYINTSLSQETQDGFEKWKIFDDSQINFCSVQDDETEVQYVDLNLNPERYTGYKGPSAHRVWKSIYKENCFRENSNLNEPLTSFNQENTCIEKRTFFRAISGLHASINIHLSSKYLLDDGKTDSIFKSEITQVWGPNVLEFRKHFDSNLTARNGPSWLKNLYFLYLIELKAIRKLSLFIKNYDLYTGNSSEDSDTKNAMNDLIGIIETFPHHFEEKALFSRNDAHALKAELHKSFTNITTIMDCVGCQKCKLWGKLQIKGLGTALKILFSEPFNAYTNDFLSRNEIVALFNSFGKLSESIIELDTFRNMMSTNFRIKGG